MSWIRDTEGNLINLDHVREVYIGETEADGETPAEHQVVAKHADGEEGAISTLFAGSKAECETQRDGIAAKLPMVRV